MRSLYIIVVLAVAAFGTTLPNSSLRELAVRECLCFTKNGPCNCGKATASAVVSFPTDVDVGAEPSQPPTKASMESLRCVCPKEGHDGREIGTPCACNSAVEPPASRPRPPRAVQEGQILPVIPDEPLPPLESSVPAPTKPPIYCFCLIRDPDGETRPCKCNQATSHLGTAHFVNQ